MKTLWLSVCKSRFEEHEVEEDYAFSRLLSGYEAPRHSEIVSGCRTLMYAYIKSTQEDFFGDFADSKATFREQVDFDQGIDVLELDERIDRRVDVSVVPLLYHLH